MARQGCAYGGLPPPPQGRQVCGRDDPALHPVPAPPPLLGVTHPPPPSPSPLRCGHASTPVSQRGTPYPLPLTPPDPPPRLPFDFPSIPLHPPPLQLSLHPHSSAAWVCSAASRGKPPVEGVLAIPPPPPLPPTGDACAASSAPDHSTHTSSSRRVEEEEEEEEEDSAVGPAGRHHLYSGR